MTESGFLDAVAARFTDSIPHSRECGMSVEHLSAEYAQVLLPYRPEWLGDSEHGLIHPGIVTTLIDTVCGVALLGAIGKFEAIATLDLRVDYLRPARPGGALHCRAECYRLTRHIAFMRASAWQDDPAEPIAASQSTFMRGSSRRRGPL